MRGGVDEAEWTTRDDLAVDLASGIRDEFVSRKGRTAADRKLTGYRDIAPCRSPGRLSADAALVRDG